MTPSPSFTADYQALTTGCGFVAWRDWTTVTMTGHDRLPFLHNMCTNDTRRLLAGEGCEAFCTDVKGKIVAHLFVIARDHQLDLITVPGQAQTLIAHLERYIIREDVQLHDASSETCWLLIAGANAAAALTDCDAQANLENPWQHRLLTMDGVECLVARCDLLNSAGFLLHCGSRQRAQVTQRLAAAGARSCSTAAWSAVRIESGLPLFGIDFSSANLPQEVDRDQQAISFNKGCYLGQETIARIDALGHVNQKVVLVQLADTRVIDAEPQTDRQLTAAGKSVGRITSACWSPRYQAAIALALVRRGSNDVGTELESRSGAATVIAS